MSQKNLETPEKGIAISKIIGKSDNTKFNKSSYFLLPIILDLGNRYKGFLNSYLYDVNNDMDGDECYLYVELNSLNTNIINHKKYICHRKTKSGYLYTFDIKEYKKDIEMFINGKYSMLSNKLKNLLCSKTEQPAIMSDIYKILYRTDDKRKKIEELIGQKLHPDAEVCSICNLNEEIFYEG